MLENLPDVNALPAVVELGPARDAVDVGDDLDPGESEKLLPRPDRFLLDEAEAAEAPPAEIHARGEPVGQHRPLLRQDLAGRQALDGFGINLFHAPTIHENRVPSFQAR